MRGCWPIVMKKILGLLALSSLAAGCGDTDFDQAVANGATKLGKAEATAALADHTLIGRIPHVNIDFTLYYAPDGRLVGAISGAMKGRDRGAWRVADDGQVCLRWANWEESAESCRTLWRDGDALKIFEEKSGRAVSVAQSKAGNVQKLEVRSDLDIVQGKEPLAPIATAELRTMLPGNTVTGRTAKGSEQHTHYAADNRVWVSAPEDVIKDRGTYRITDDGQVCATWSYLYGAHERCERWFKGSKGYSVFDAYGSLALIGKTRPGDPEQLAK